MRVVDAQAIARQRICATSVFGITLPSKNQALWRFRVSGGSVRIAENNRPILRVKRFSTNAAHHFSFRSKLPYLGSTAAL
jgi:hypothetical protein